MGGIWNLHFPVLNLNHEKNWELSPREKETHPPVFVFVQNEPNRDENDIPEIRNAIIAELEVPEEETKENKSDYVNNSAEVDIEDEIVLKQENENRNEFTESCIVSPAQTLRV